MRVHPLLLSLLLLPLNGTAAEPSKAPATEAPVVFNRRRKQPKK